MICEMWLFNLFFLNSANLTCVDLSKFSRESLGLRYNESRLYDEIIALSSLNQKGSYSRQNLLS